MPTIPFYDMETVHGMLGLVLDTVRDLFREKEGRDVERFRRMEQRLEIVHQDNRDVNQLVNVNERQRQDLMNANTALEETEEMLAQVLAAVPTLEQNGESEAQGELLKNTQEEKELNGTVWFILSELSFLDLRRAQEGDGNEVLQLQRQLTEYLDQLLAGS